MLSYTAIDFETANSYRGSPCAVGLVRVRNGEPVAEERWLMRPPEAADGFDAFNIWVHGITPDMVVSEPRWKDMLPRIMGFIGDDVLATHNAGFDIGVMRYACAADNIDWPELRFLCTLVMSRRLLALPSYRLPFVAEALGISMENHHDPVEDARVVVRVVASLARSAGVDDLDSLAASAHIRIGYMSAGVYQGSGSGDGSGALVRPEVDRDADPDGYLFGRVVVFTGALMSMTRQTAWEACARVGAAPELNTTKRTNVLVVGDLNPAKLRPGEDLSAKARRAFGLQGKGQDIEVMTEDDFLRCLDGGR